MSVWRGGKALLSNYDAFYDSVIWRGVRGLWEPHAQAAAESLGVEGLLARAGWLLPQCRRQVVDCVAEGGKRSQSYSCRLRCSLLGFLEGEGGPGFALVAAEV